MGRRTVRPMMCALAVGVVLGGVGVRTLPAAPPVVVREAAATTSSFLPACPHFSHAADGAVGPIFCTIDNPRALSYYAKALKPLLALGPHAKSGQVQIQLSKEMRGGGPHGQRLTGTIPIQCQVFQLAAHRWRWGFLYTPPDCPPPPNP